MPSGTPTEIKAIDTPTPTPTPPTPPSTEGIDISNINNLRDKVIIGYNTVTKQSSSDVLKYMIKIGNKKINEFYHQLGTFIIDNTKSAYNYTNSMISSSTQVIRDTTRQLYNTIYSTSEKLVPIEYGNDSSNSIILFILPQEN